MRGSKTWCCRCRIGDDSDGGAASVASNASQLYSVVLIRCTVVAVISLSTMSMRMSLLWGRDTRGAESPCDCRALALVLVLAVMRRGAIAAEMVMTPMEGRVRSI